VQPYRTQAGLQASAPHGRSPVLQPHRHRHLPLLTSNRPLMRQWHTTQQLPRRLSLSPIARRHHHRQTLMTALGLELPLSMINMSPITGIRCKLLLHHNQLQGHTSLGHLHQGRDLPVHQVRAVRTHQVRWRAHHKVRRRLHHLRLLLHQVNTTDTPHRLQP
jgi:hypothetical protein